MVKLKINRKTVRVPDGTTVLNAARQAGISIPTLCDHPDLHPYGGCRLCIVEVEGSRLPATACNLPVSEGMSVQTETPAIVQMRRTLLKLILSTYYDAEAGEGHETEFTHWCKHYGLDIKANMASQPRYQVNSDPNPFVWVDLNKCIICTRCIRACEEVQGRFVWHLANRGYNTRITAGSDVSMLEARCESCGACAAYCPTGALDHKLSIHQPQPERVVTTVCTYCGVGCTLDLNIKDDRVISVSSSPAAPVNGMALCVKGRYGYDFIHHPDRLQQPMVRRYLLENSPRPTDRGEWVAVDWDTALDITARKLAGLRDTYGADSIGVLTSAKCLNEENYLMNKYARQVIGTNTIDHCARL